MFIGKEVGPFSGQRGLEQTEQHTILYDEDVMDSTVQHVLCSGVVTAGGGAVLGFWLGPLDRGQAEHNSNV